MGTHGWFAHTFLKCGCGLSDSAGGRFLGTKPTDSESLGMAMGNQFLSSTADGGPTHQGLEKHWFRPNGAYP